MVSWVWIALNSNWAVFSWRICISLSFWDMLSFKLDIISWRSEMNCYWVFSIIWFYKSFFLMDSTYSFWVPSIVCNFAVIMINSLSFCSLSCFSFYIIDSNSANLSDKDNILTPSSVIRDSFPARTSWILLRVIFLYLSSFSRLILALSSYRICSPNFWTSLFTFRLF